MILRLVLFLLSIFVLTNLNAETDFFADFEKQKSENIIFNEKVTDKEIVEYFERFLKYQPATLHEFNQQSVEDRNTFLVNYKKYHIEAGMKIPVLTGMSQEDLQKFDVIAKYKADEFIRVESAQKRLLSYSNNQYKLMISEAIKLIDRYEEYENNDSSGRIFIKDNFPDALKSFDLHSIYLFNNRCELLLQNGIGRDIGYSISQDKTGTWIIESFDHYTNWQTTKIEITE